MKSFVEQEIDNSPELPRPSRLKRRLLKAYSYLSNSRGGGNKRERLDFLENVEGVVEIKKSGKI